MCQNCEKNEVTFRYTQVINGVKKELNLCDNCARELGLKDMNFSMPISFSSFLGDFFNDYSDTLLPSFMGTQTTKCKKCGESFDEFLNSGEFGCSNCYDLFEDRITPILKNLQGATKHTGRGYKKIFTDVSENETDKVAKTVKKEESEISKLQKELQKAIKTENYEEAAKIRDEIKELEGSKNEKKANKKEEKKNIEPNKKEIEIEDENDNKNSK